jgi:gamma-glutamyl:cysteine ligase YbdK (ATP-grasp superfamily)
MFCRRSWAMTPRFTIGIEEEFQMVDKQTGADCSHRSCIFVREQRYKMAFCDNTVMDVPYTQSVRGDLSQKKEGRLSGE